MTSIKAGKAQKKKLKSFVMHNKIHHIYFYLQTGLLIDPM